MTDFPLIPRTPASKLRYILEQLAGVHAQDSAGQTRLIGAQMALEQLAEELEAAPEFPLPIRPDGTHWYVSTACGCTGDKLMADGRTGHAYCQGMTGYQGAKRGGRAKCCGAPCRCECHQTRGPMSLMMKDTGRHWPMAVDLLHAPTTPDGPTLTAGFDNTIEIPELDADGLPIPADGCDCGRPGGATEPTGHSATCWLHRRHWTRNQPPVPAPVAGVATSEEQR
jgi:hypothetical protein